MRFSGGCPLRRTGHYPGNSGRRNSIIEQLNHHSKRLMIEMGVVLAACVGLYLGGGMVDSFWGSCRFSCSYVRTVISAR